MGFASARVVRGRGLGRRCFLAKGPLVGIKLSAPVERLLVGRRDPGQVGPAND